MKKDGKKSKMRIREESPNKRQKLGGEKMWIAKVFLSQCWLLCMGLQVTKFLESHWREMRMGNGTVLAY